LGEIVFTEDKRGVNNQLLSLLLISCSVPSASCMYVTAQLSTWQKPEGALVPSRKSISIVKHAFAIRRDMK
jgi:hypothetical protein